MVSLGLAPQLVVWLAMSSTLMEPPRQTQPVDDAAPAQPELALLEDRMPAHLKVSRRFAACVALFGLIYAWSALRPLWHTDLWGHLSYGRWIAEAMQLPQWEPLLPLAQGVPFVDTAWLSQVIGYVVYQQLGIAGLQGLVGVTTLVTSLVLYHRLQSRTRSFWVSWLGMGLFFWLTAGLLAIARPQLAGLFCCVVLLHRLTSRRPRNWDYALIPALVAVWANLHGSFVVGLGLIGVFLVGRCLDLLRRTGTVRSLFHDASVRRLLVTGQLAMLAGLINPYGAALYMEVLTVSQHPNLRSLTEWQPLDVRTGMGQAFLASAIGLMLLYRFTPRRVAAWEPLVLIGLGCATLLSARFALWWGPVAAYTATLHIHAALRKWLPWRGELAPSPINGKWSIVSLGLVWIFFAYSPLGMRLVHGKEPNIAKAVSSMTPVGIAEWLNEHPPQGLVFNPYEWGDFLQWAGPPGLPLFLNSHAHLLPREVWQHYLSVVEQSTEGAQVLDRYGINTVVLDTRYRSSLIRRLKDDAQWKLSYEDNRGAIFERRNPI